MQESFLKKKKKLLFWTYKPKPSKDLFITSNFTSKLLN